MNAAASLRWTVQPADAADLAGLHGLDGFGPGAPQAGDRTWVARAQPGGPPLATLRLRRGIGQPVPQAWFRLGWAVHAAAELQLYLRQRTLLLGNDLTGAHELTGFAAAADLGGDRAADAWAALLDSALEGLGDDGGGEPRPCIAQLPGLRDAVGRSPVWQGLGRHFHAQDLEAARRQHGPDWERHVAMMLPRHPVYVSLLPAAAQAALGQAAPAAEPLRQALLQAGFGWREHVGIVDGGPVLERWPAGR